MNRIKQSIIIAISLCVALPAAQAQMKGWEAGAWIGGSNYFGDLNTNWRLNRIGLSAGAGARYNLNDRLAVKLSANYGNISATDSDSRNIFEQRRNLSFKSMIIDGTAHFEFNFLPYAHGSREYYYTPYVFLGPSFFYFNPRTELDGTWYNLRDYGTEGQFRGEEYNTTQFALAYGMGFKIDLNYRFSLNVELSARKLFNDYIDDVSGNYADERDIRAQRGATAAALADRSAEPQIGGAGRQRGNGKNNDMFVLANVGVMYYFGQIRCPSMLR